MSQGSSTLESRSGVLALVLLRHLHTLRTQHLLLTMFCLQSSEGTREREAGRLQIALKPILGGPRSFNNGRFAGSLRQVNTVCLSSISLTTMTGAEERRYDASQKI